MIDDATRDLLHDLLRRESRSLFQYAREVPPWANSHGRPAVAKLGDMAAAEERVVDALGRYLQKARAGLAVIGPYPSAFTSLNDAAVGHMVKLIIPEQSAATEQLKKDLPHVRDPQAAAYLTELLALKQRHVKELETLTGRPEVAA